uniref:Uncharacterized protein n=1 Tax=Arundo donax TaxID=35708 RepID=A0A0A8YC79_ARUDO
MTSLQLHDSELCRSVKHLQR